MFYIPISTFRVSYKATTQIFHRETSQATPPPPPKRSYDVSRGQHRYVTFPVTVYKRRKVPFV